MACLVLIKMGGTHIAFGRTALNHFNKPTAEFSQMLQNSMLTICQHSEAFCLTGCYYVLCPLSFLSEFLKKKKKNHLFVFMGILTYFNLTFLLKNVIALSSRCLSQGLLQSQALSARLQYHARTDSCHSARKGGAAF